MKSTTLRIGDTDVPRIGLGTNRLTKTDENIAFIRQAVELGVGMIDTAYTYTDGQSEETIAEALSPIPESCIVATKGGYAPGTGRPEVLRTQIDESLRRLKTDEIDLYYLHRVHEDTMLQDSVGTIAAYHDGLSQVGIDQIEQAREIVTITAVQNHYNLSERGWDEVVDHCAGEGIVFVPYFPLKGSGGRAVDEIAEHHGATAAQIRLAWLLRRSPATLPIPGTLSVEHLKENLAALEIELTDAEFDALS
jgi:aryl-alcohol dehydrogenase-like predicted oxidoreductase